MVSRSSPGQMQGSIFSNDMIMDREICLFKKNSKYLDTFWSKRLIFLCIRIKIFSPQDCLARGWWRWWNGTRAEEPGPVLRCALVLVAIWSGYYEISPTSSSRIHQRSNFNPVTSDTLLHIHLVIEFRAIKTVQSYAPAPQHGLLQIHIKLKTRKSGIRATPRWWEICIIVHISSVSSVSKFPGFSRTSRHDFHGH